MCPCSIGGVKVKNERPNIFMKQTRNQEGGTDCSCAGNMPNNRFEDASLEQGMYYLIPSPRPEICWTGGLHQGIVHNVNSSDPKEIGRERNGRLAKTQNQKHEICPDQIVAQMTDMENIHNAMVSAVRQLWYPKGGK